MSNQELMAQKMADASRLQKEGRMSEAVVLLKQVVDESTELLPRFMAARELYIVFARDPSRSAQNLDGGSPENRELLKYVRIVIGAYPHIHSRIQQETDIESLRQLDQMYSSTNIPVQSDARSTDMDAEFEKFEEQAEAMDRISNRFSQVDAQTLRHLHEEYQQKLGQMERHIAQAKRLYPYDDRVPVMEAYFLINESRLKLQYNDSDAALKLLNHSIDVFDMDMTRIVRAGMYAGMQQKELALIDLNHIISKPPSNDNPYADENLYTDALRMKREIEAGGGSTFGLSSPGKNQTLPMVSLALGILGFVLTCCYGGFPLGLAALVIGFLGLQNANNYPETYGGKVLAIAGMAAGGLAFFVNLIFVIAVFTMR